MKYRLVEVVRKLPWIMNSYLEFEHERTSRSGVEVCSSRSKDLVGKFRP